MNSIRAFDCEDDLSINDKYQLIRELGSGAQGSVYCIMNIQTGQKYAAKLYKKYDRFLLEQDILKVLAREEGFPRAHDSIIIEDHPLLIMDALGANLRSLKENNGNNLCEITCLQVMLQLINRLEKLHKAGFVHCDLKPDNILIGNDETNCNTIYLIDYGLAHSYIDKLTGCHIKQPNNVSFKGSISYCSLNLFKKLYPSRRDDIESLIYVILFLLNGELPWHEGAQKLRGQERLNYVIKLKQELDIKHYGEFIPNSIIKSYKYVRQLGYTDEPDYQLIRFFILKDLEKSKHKSHTFEWNNCINKLKESSSIQDYSQQIYLQKSYFEREYHRLSVESKSLEVDYQDIMSQEIEEGINIQVQGMSPKQNQLSQLSPNSSRRGSSICYQFSDAQSLMNMNDQEIAQKLINNTNFCLNVNPVPTQSKDDFFGTQTEEQDELEEFSQKTRRFQSFKTDLKEVRKLVSQFKNSY